MARLWTTLALVTTLAVALPASAEEDAPVEPTPKVAIDGLADRADVLLITSDALADAWKPFADWKTRTGRPTRVVTLSTIEAEYEGDDLQQKIRACTRKHIETAHTRWVVLGGDSGKDGTGVVPDRDTHHSDYFKYEDIPTDLYYLSEGDWDANDDGVYGRFTEDMDAVDYGPEGVSIGRIPVRTTEDVAAYVEKVIAYESDYPTDEFAGRMIYTCPERHAYPKLGTSIRAVEAAWEAGDVGYYFAHKTPWDTEAPGDHALSAPNWVSLVNERGASKLHMHGHGFNNLWVLEDKSKITAATVAKLTNENAYPVITTVSCWTGEYDSEKDPSITESMLRQPKGGAIAIIAPSREGIPVFHDRSDMRLMVTEGKLDGTTQTMTHFWTAALTDAKTLGEAFHAAKAKMTADARRTDAYHFVQCELNLLGDPTLPPRATPPRAIPAKLVVTDATLALSGVAGCRVCLWDGADHYEVHDADEAGTLHLALPASKTWTLSAFAPDRNAWVHEQKAE